MLFSEREIKKIKTEKKAHHIADIKTAPNRKKKSENIKARLIFFKKSVKTENHEGQKHNHICPHKLVHKSQQILAETVADRKSCL